MNCSKKDLLLYLVTDRNFLQGRALATDVEKTLRGGATMVQLREKDLPQEAFLETAREIKGLCRNYRVPFLINDNIEVAMAVDADGVHLGQDDLDCATARRLLGPQKIIGVSAQTVAQAKQAEAAGADYLGVGAVFPTISKDDAAAVSYATLQAICQSVQIPVVAIGGIKAENIAALAQSGICGVAVISAILGAADIEAATHTLRMEAGKLFSPLLGHSGAIFDMDGTLLDSMPIYRDLGNQFLLNHGVVPPANLREIVAPLSLEESAVYFSENFPLHMQPEEILEEWRRDIRHAYSHTVPAKPGVLEYLAKLRDWGIPMAVATLTNRPLAMQALDRLGLRPYFQIILSAHDVGRNKHFPDIYYQAAAALGQKPADCLVFEDAFYAANTAKQAGFAVCGVHDESSEHSRGALLELCDYYIEGFPQLL